MKLRTKLNAITRPEWGCRDLRPDRQSALPRLHRRHPHMGPSPGVLNEPSIVEGGGRANRPRGIRMRSSLWWPPASPDASPARATGRRRAHHGRGRRSAGPGADDASCSGAAQPGTNCIRSAAGGQVRSDARMAAGNSRSRWGTPACVLAMMIFRRLCRLRPIDSASSASCRHRPGAFRLTQRWSRHTSSLAATIFVPARRHDRISPAALSSRSVLRRATRGRAVAQPLSQRSIPAAVSSPSGIWKGARAAREITFRAAGPG